MPEDRHPEAQGSFARWTRVSLRARGVAVLTFPMAALFAALVSIYWADGDVRDAELTLSRSYELRSTALAVGSALADAESAVGGFNSTRLDRFREDYRTARRKAEQALARLPAVVGPDREAARQTANLQAATTEEMNLLGVMLGASEESRARLLPQSNVRMNRARALLAALTARGELDYVNARNQREAVRRQLFATLMLCGVLGPLGTMMVHLLVAGRLVRRIQALEENARRLAHGLPLEPLPHGTDEIASLARQLEDASFLLRHREQEMQASEGRYRNFFDQAPIPYEETDRYGVVRRFNQAVCNLLKTAPEQLVGYCAWDFIAPDQQEAFRTHMMERIASGQEGGNFTCDLLMRSGARIGVEIRENFVRNEAGEVIAVLRSLMDVTERNVAAEAARRVEQYALELRNRNEQLGHALEAARNAVSAKGRFLAGVSHELRTPLNAIIGFAEILHDGRLGPVTEDHKECLNDILTSARHLLRLINDVLDLAKVEAGKMEFRPELCSIRGLVEEVRDVIRPLADKGGQLLVLEVEYGLNATLDPARFKQVLYNYLSNAVKFTPAGGRVMVRVTPEDSYRFRLEVEDTGIGIPPDEVARLFQEFQQLPNNKKAGQGTGLGLALTRLIVEAQGGSVAVKSVEGKGSVFSAILPLRHHASGATNGIEIGHHTTSSGIE